MAPPYLMPELIEKILVRLPPDNPAGLVRASLVCKRWRLLLCNPAFRSRYVAFHRAPPMLGFLHNWHTNIHGAPCPRFVSTTTTPSPLPLQAFLDRRRDSDVFDCRHGRVLLKNYLSWSVLDPTTRKEKRLPEPPFQGWMVHTAAVLCAVRGCHHLDCHSGPFLVVVVGFNVEDGVLQSHLYSSEATTWISSAYPGPGSILQVGRLKPSVPLSKKKKPNVLIGDGLYFIIASPSVTIWKVDLGQNELSIINQPGAGAQLDFFDRCNVVLMALEDGSLGFAAILDSVLCLHSMNVMNSEVAGGWALCMSIELRTKIPFNHSLRIVGSKEGSGIIFVASDVGVFSLDVESECSHGSKVDEPREDFAIFPFTSFYTPDGFNSKFRPPIMGPD